MRRRFKFSCGWDAVTILPGGDVQPEEQNKLDLGFSIRSRFGEWMSDSFQRYELLDLYQELNVGRDENIYRLSDSKLQEVVLPRLQDAFESGQLVAMLPNRPAVGAASVAPGDNIGKGSDALKRDDLPEELWAKRNRAQEDPLAGARAVTTESKKEESWWDRVSGTVHTALDVAGLIPVVGEIADGVNAAIYAAEGDYKNAALSAAAMVPVVGAGATVGKLGIKVGKEIAEEGAEAVVKTSMKEGAEEGAETVAKGSTKEVTEEASEQLLKRKQELGTDPKRGYIEHEGEVGALIEGKYGGFKRDLSGDAEWISQSGPYKDKSFDLVGVPPGKAQYHSDDMEKFLPSVDSHFRKSIDYVVLDTRHMRPAQKKAVMDHVEKSWSTQKDRLILLE